MIENRPRASVVAAFGDVVPVTAIVPPRNDDPLRERLVRLVADVADDREPRVDDGIPSDLRAFGALERGGRLPGRRASEAEISTVPGARLPSRNEPSAAE